MDATRKGQVTRSAADIYEEFFVPALFAEWAGRVADAARIGTKLRMSLGDINKRFTVCGIRSAVFVGANNYSP